MSKDISQPEVARRVDVHRQSAGRWALPLEREGRWGLKRSGHKPQLRDRERLAQALKRGPEQVG